MITNYQVLYRKMVLCHRTKKVYQKLTNGKAKKSLKLKPLPEKLKQVTTKNTRKCIFLDLWNWSSRLYWLFPIHVCMLILYPKIIESEKSPIDFSGQPRLCKQSSFSGAFDLNLPKTIFSPWFIQMTQYSIFGSLFFQRKAALMGSRRLVVFSAGRMQTGTNQVCADFWSKVSENSTST